MSVSWPDNFVDPLNIGANGISEQGPDTGWGAPFAPIATAPQVAVRWDKPCCAVAFALGLAGIIGAMVIYRSGLPNVLKIGLATAMISGLTVLGASLTAIITGRLPVIMRDQLWIAFALIVLLFGAGCLLQFIYGLQSGAVYTPIDDYLFVIDDSGSMADNDPQKKRLSALQVLLDNIGEDKRAGLLCFNDAVTDTVPLEPVTAYHAGRLLGMNLRDDGGTDIYNAIVSALAMPGANDPNRALMIVLLTDGFSGATVPLNQLTQMCAANNAKVTTIGTSSGVDERMLRRIAAASGGAFYWVDNLDQLSGIYTSLDWIDNSRDLIGIRTGVARASVLYGVMRIVFWMLLGAIAGTGAWAIFSSRPNALLTLVVSTTAGLVCGLLLELLSVLMWGGAVLQSIPLVTLCPLLVYYNQPIKKPITGSSPFDFPGGETNALSSNQRPKDRFSDWDKMVSQDRFQ